MTSSIADGSALTTPTPWIADVTGVAADPVNRVEFLIDGASSWVERFDPYTFNDDGELFIPWVLEPGDHRLGIDVYTSEGVAATWQGDVSTTRPPVPKELEGQAFTRDTEQQGCDLCGVWRMEFGANGVIQIVDPLAGELTDTFEATSDGVIDLYGPASWTVPESSGGGFCEPVGVATMHWRMKGKALVLSTSGAADTCPARAKLYVGTWAPA